MRRYKQYRKAFGVDEFGFPMIPKKYSNVRVSRLKNFEKVGGCSYCFPHGFECTNSTVDNIQKSWKNYRKKQYKTKYDNGAFYNSKAYRKHGRLILNFFNFQPFIIKV